MEQNIPAFMNNRGAGLLAQGHQQGNLPNQRDMPDESNVTPEEQDQYDKFVANSIMFIHGDKSDDILGQLAEGEPEQALADVLVGIVTMLQQSAAQAKKPISQEVIANGGEEILNELINFAIEAGVYNMEEVEAEEVQQEAFLIAIDLYGQYAAEAGLIDMEETQQAAAEAESGKYDHLLKEPVQGIGE